MDHLFDEIVAGSTSAFAQVYRAAYPTVFRTVFAVLRDGAQTEEVTQEVFLELWQTADRFDRELSSAMTWVVTIARRRAVDRVRSSASARARDDRVVREALPLTEPDPADEVVQRLAAEDIREALLNIHHAQREILELAYLDALSHSDLARRLNIPVGTVKSRIRLATKRMRAALGLRD